MIRVLPFLALLFVSAARAEPIKHGRVMCEGSSCSDGDVEGAPHPLKNSNAPGVSASKSSLPKPAKAEAKLRISSSHYSTPARVADTRGERLKHLSRAPAPRVRTGSLSGSNLPDYYQGVDRTHIEASDKVMFEPKSHNPKLRGLRPGDLVWGAIDQEIVASPELPTPVRVIANSGAFKGAVFVGEATLEKELKRVCLNFTKVRLPGEDSSYSVKASGLSPKGSVCLEGDYVSQTGKFFLAELAASAAAAALDSTVQRSQTALGTYVEAPSLSNSGKTAAVQALSKTTDRVAEMVRQAPEYTRLNRSQEIQIMILEEPTESGT